jgi:hypothetical protein
VSKTKNLSKKLQSKLDALEGVEYKLTTNQLRDHGNKQQNDIIVDIRNESESSVYNETPSITSQTPGKL